MALAGLVSVVILSGFVSFAEKSLTMSATDMALAGLGFSCPLAFSLVPFLGPFVSLGGLVALGPLGGLVTLGGVVEGGVVFPFLGPFGSLGGLVKTLGGVVGGGVLVEGGWSRGMW